MRLVSFNVNGLRACLSKGGFMESFRGLSADVFCLQETKMERGQAVVDLPGYEQYWNSAQKKGYSGTAVFTRLPVLEARLGIGLPEHDAEGRVITLRLKDLYLVNVYTPNAQHELLRLAYRMRWEDDFRAYLLALDREAPVVVCGDMNVAHCEIDIKNPAANRLNPGFTDQERAKMTQLLQSGFTDTFRALHPSERDRYTWWSYRPGVRERNVGWRIDYFLCSSRLMPRVSDAAIHQDVMGSDHCPVSLTLAESGG